MTFPIVDHRKVGPIRKGVFIALFQRARLPGRVLALQRVEHTRYSRGTGLGARQGLDHLAGLAGADAANEHLADRCVQFDSTAIVLVKELGLMSIARTRHRQVFDQTHGRLQVARVVSISIVAPLRCALVGQGPDQSADLVLQDRH